MLVARPLAVTLCLAPFRYRAREIGFISWVGLRGAVGIFLASIPMLANLDNALVYFNVAFVVVCVSLLVQGWTMRPAANRSEEHTSELQSLMRISYAVFCLKQKNTNK